MKILEPGHVYVLSQIDAHDDEGAEAVVLRFVNREDNPHPGTQTQEVLRALIDRTIHCDNCLRWEGNDRIIYHLRMALALHEGRHLERMVEKGAMVERLAVGADGHLALANPTTQRYDAKETGFEDQKARAR